MATKHYLVYYISFDRDFDNQPSIYALGLYDNEAKAKEICNRDFCKNTHYKEFKNNQEVFVEL